MSTPATAVLDKVPKESQQSYEEGGGVGRSPKKPAAASVLGSGVSLQDGLGNNDALGLHIALFLYGWEVCYLSATSRYWRSLLQESVWLWQRLASRDVAPPIFASLKTRLAPPTQAPPGLSPSVVSASSWRGLYETSVRMGVGGEVEWGVSQRPVMPTFDSGPHPLRPMEGHAAALLHTRWAVIVGGFGRGIMNDVYVSDTLHWGHQPQHGACRLQQWWAVPLVLEGGVTGPSYQPPRVYGHTALPLPFNHSLKLLVYGGVRFGGYQGAVNEAYVIELEPDPSSDGRLIGPFLATRILVRPVGPPPTRRAYCSLTLGGEWVWCFGGLTEGQCTNTLQALPLTCLNTPQPNANGIGSTYMGQWAEPQASGSPPSERMGHSCVWIDRDRGGGGGGGCLVVAGGSDGTDLLRDGRELNDIHLLNITPITMTPQPSPLGPSPSPSTSLVCVWSTVAQDPPPLALGRTHSAHLTGNGSIVYFGGSARLSQSLALLTLHPPQPLVGLGEWQGTWKQPHSRGRPPARRISHVSLLVGPYMWVHGGWGGHELGDCVMLNLAPPLHPSSSSSSATALQSQGYGNNQTAQLHQHDWADSEEGEEAVAEALGGCVQS